MRSSFSKETLGVIAAFAAYAFWAICDAIVKLLHGRIPSFEVVVIGMGLGCLFLPLLKRRDERFRDMWPIREPGLLIGRCVAFLVQAIASIVVFTNLPMAEAFCILFLYPAIATVLSVTLLGETVSKRRWVGVLLGFLGVLIVLRPGFRNLGIGHIAGLLGAFAAAAVVILLKHGGGKEHRLTWVAAGLVGPVVSCIPLVVFAPIVPSLHETILLLVWGAFAVAGMALQMFAAASAPSTSIAAPQYSQMLWALLFNQFLFGDRMDGLMYLGATIIVGSGLLMALEKRAAPPITQTVS